MYFRAEKYHQYYLSVMNLSELILADTSPWYSSITGIRPNLFQVNLDDVEDEVHYLFNVTPIYLK